MIELDTSLIVGYGTKRVCFQHPEESDLAVKIPIGGKKEGHLSNLKELKGYCYLIQNHHDLLFISHCYGIVSTNLGKGLLTDSIKDGNGNHSQSIWDIIVYQDNCDISLIKNIVSELCEQLIAHDIFLFDLNLKNILLKQQPDGNWIPVIIDLKGRYDNNEFIPLSSYIKFLARIKLKRRCSQLVSRISEFRQMRTELQTIDEQKKKKFNQTMKW